MAQVKARVYVPVHVGDVLKFGQSSRLYVFQGPAELMPEEGLSRTEKQQLKRLEAAQVRALCEIDWQTAARCPRVDNRGAPNPQRQPASQGLLPNRSHAASRRTLFGAHGP